MNTKQLFLIFFCLSFINFNPFAHAAKIKAVKGKKVLIYFEADEKLQKGELYRVKNKKGQTIGYIKIKKVKPRKALGYLIKGKARKNAVLQLKSKKQKADKNLQAATNHKTFGLLMGMNFVSMDVKKVSDDSQSVTAQTSGTNINLKGIYDHPLTKRWDFRAGLGYESLSAKGTTVLDVCESSNSCSTKISYLRIDGIVRYKWDNSYSPWIGAGASFLTPMSKKSNVIKTQTLDYNQSIIFAFGLDKKLSSKSFIPINIEYNYFPASSTVSTSLINVQIGYGYRF